MGNLVCCVQVDQSQVAMKEGFGKFEKVLQPGCHCMPWFLGKTNCWSSLSSAPTIGYQMRDQDKGWFVTF